MKQYRLKQNDKLIVHPAAINAVIFAQSFSVLFDDAILEKTACCIINEIHFDAAKISSEKSTYALFSPIHHIAMFEPQIKQDLKTVLLYSDGELTDKEIEHKAWVSVLSAIMLSPDQTTILSQLQQQLNEQVPEHILIEFFGKSKISQQCIAYSTNHNIDTIKSQTKKNKKREKESFSKLSQFDGFPTDMLVED